MRTPRSRVTSVAAALVAAVLALGVAPLPSAAAQGDGLHHLGTTRLSPRLEELRFATPAVVGETRVRVLLPDGYDASTDRYPVLWLLHGGGGSFRDWTDTGQAAELTAGLPLIVVMPDTGPFGGYSDWWNHGAGGPPMWETYHLGQLLPWIDEHYRTVGDRSGRAIAGLSMGGGGAIHYAARRPDLFVGAAAFSGAVDTNTLPVQLLVTGSGLQELKPPGAQVGLRLTEEVRWRGHNPQDLAENLQGLFLQLDTGNGQPGGPGGDLGDPVEGQCWQMMTNLHQRLDQLGYPHHWNDYGPGGHTWFYWRRDLTELLPRLMAVFADPPPAPARVRYTSIDPTWSVYGWDVAIERRAIEFATLRDADRGGFALQGSGRATVTTPPTYEPGQRVAASISDAAGSHERELVADATGRLAVAVDLGPANTEQQYSPAGHVVAAANAGTWPSTTARVTLAPHPSGQPPAAPAPAGTQELPATGGEWSPAWALVLAGAAWLSARVLRSLQPAGGVGAEAPPEPPTREGPAPPGPEPRRARRRRTDEARRRPPQAAEDET